VEKCRSTTQIPDLKRNPAATSSFHGANHHRRVRFRAAARAGQAGEGRRDPPSPAVLFYFSEGLDQRTNPSLPAGTSPKIKIEWFMIISEVYVIVRHFNISWHFTSHLSRDPISNLTIHYKFCVKSQDFAVCQNV
jgi:hypothetical protein